MKKHKQIICTIGPASSDRNTLLAMSKAGMDIARLNFSHGTHEEHQQVIDAIRYVNRKYKRRIKILQDLEGYRIRVGVLKKPIPLTKGAKVVMTTCEKAKHPEIPLEFSEMKQLKKNMCLHIDDGQICLRVLKNQGCRIVLEVEDGGVLKSKKGVNIPGLQLKGNIVTEKDKLDLAFGLQNKIDYLAQSFVRNAEDIKKVKQIVKSALPRCIVIAKIENEDGVKNVEKIMKACDGILVARGDLGVTMPIHQLPFIQKKILKLCHQKNKIGITATQMLESMTHSKRPTRAEVSDVANAILDGTQCVTLSGETAVGEYPVNTIEMMKSIITYAQKFRT